jgi:hypothetical protein
MIIPNSDVPLISPSYKIININKYSEEPNISKIIYIQSRIRYYMRKKKNLNKYPKNVLTSKNKAKTIISNSSNAYIKEKSLKKTISVNKVLQSKQTTTKFKNKNNMKKIKTIGGENYLNFPRVDPRFRSNKLFSEDPFSRPTTSKTLINDPRNGPLDNIRRFYPKIEQDEFSYEGEWKNGHRDGLGVLVWKGIAKFIGEFIEDRVKGFGLLFHDDGSQYIGYWNEFQAHGLGIYRIKKTISYEGWWVNDRQSGFGIENWPRNTWFKGNYLKGNKEGIGILNIEDKGSYEGEMKTGNINGIGKFTFHDGRKYEGEFKNNKLEGYGILNWPDGKIFVGNFKEDIQEGFGVFYSTKKIYIGIWKSSLLNGEAIIIENNKVKKQLWEEGRPSENLPNEHKIIFEKYVEKFIKEKKYYISK